MPVGNEQYVTEMDIRLFLRDTDPDENLLLDDLEFTGEEITQAMTHAVDIWNDTNPPGFTFDYTVFPYRSALIKGTAGTLLRMAAIRFNRNDLTYQIGGGTATDQRKGAPYDQMASRLLQEYKEWVMGKKRSLNVHSGWGAV